MDDDLLSPRAIKYYYHGGQRVAKRTAEGIYYLHGDHLGSTSLVTNHASEVVARQLYYPYGAPRPGGSGTLPTDYTFTGQRAVPGTGLMYYKARYYHPALGRFVRADTLVPNPGNPQDLNRYAYALGNPLRYTDPTGHCTGTPQSNPDCWQKLYELEGTFGVDIDVEHLAYRSPVLPWELTDLANLETALKSMLQMLGQQAFGRTFAGLVFRIVKVNSAGAPGLYEWLGNELTPPSHVVTLSRFYNDPQGGGYRDAYTPFIHEMWHHVDAWVSIELYGKRQTTWMSNYEYSKAAGIPPCGIGCDPSALRWEDRPWEDFADFGAHYTNIVVGNLPPTYYGGSDYYWMSFPVSQRITFFRSLIHMLQVDLVRERR